MQIVLPSIPNPLFHVVQAFSTPETTLIHHRNIRKKNDNKKKKAYLIPNKQNEKFPIIQAQ